MSFSGIWIGIFVDLVLENVFGFLDQCESCVGIYRPLCWLEHLLLHHETGVDPLGILVYVVPRLAATEYFTHEYFLSAFLIENLAKIRYNGKNLYMVMRSAAIILEYIGIKE